MKVTKNATPVLYPGDRDLSKQWFVQYPNPNGGTPLKKYGRLNKLPTLEERMQEANMLLASCNEELSLSNLQNSQLIKKLSDIVDKRMEGKKAKTRYGYASRLRTFALWYRSVDCPTMTDKSGQQFLSWVGKKNNLSNISINGYRRHLKSFFAEMKEDGDIGFNPFDKTKKLPESSSTKPWFTNNQQQLMQDAIEPIDPQLWLACMTQFYCFIRPGNELMGLKIKDILPHTSSTWKFRVVAANAKTNKPRHVIIPPALWVMLEPYIKGYDDEMYIFGAGGTPSTKMIGRNTLYNKHRLYCEALEMPKGCTFYGWKNTGAIMAYREGTKMKVISSMMGHHSIEITDIYFKSLGIDDLMDDITIVYPTIGNKKAASTT